ncbi:MAG: SET domain-containing protein-lysine N-methyltransferase [Proteobacteria bacterium]|nr:SET domain-containing protein-lysine N-methyltransferase [Pseudomonadota bacterium]
MTDIKYFIIKSLLVKNAAGKGLGVFTSEKINRGKVVEISPSIVFSGQDAKNIENCPLSNYVYDGGKSLLLGLGFTSLYNHSNSPNVEAQVSGRSIFIIALRTIEAGEELEINYGRDIEP